MHIDDNTCIEHVCRKKTGYAENLLHLLHLGKHDAIIRRHRPKNSYKRSPIFNVLINSIISMMKSMSIIVITNFIIYDIKISLLDCNFE